MEFLSQYCSSSIESSQSSDCDDLLASQLKSRDTRTVYLITYSQANLLKFGSREQFARAVVEAFSTKKVRVLQWCCSLENHKTSGKHFHAAIKLNTVRRWLPAKLYLEEHYGISAHFSDIHYNYYSAWRYVTKSDKDYVQSDGHPDLCNASEPSTSSASRAKRRLASQESGKELGEASGSSDSEAGVRSKKSKTKKRLSAFDVSEIIQQKQIKSITELQALAQQQKREGKTDLAEFLLNRPSRTVAEILKTSWEMAEAEQKLARAKKSRIELLKDALEEACACDADGRWQSCAEEVLALNPITKSEFAEAIIALLNKGRGKFRNILIIGPANCAKTFILSPLTLIFKTFSNPASGRFAWVGVDEAECIFLNDFRWNNDMIPWHDLLLLLEGQEVHLPAPKTHFARDIVLSKDTPIFATSKSEIIFIKNGIIDQRETEMMAVRWKVMKFSHQFSMERQREIPPCARCFVELLSGKSNISVCNPRADTSKMLTVPVW